MYILPKILGGWIVYSNDTAKHLYTLVRLSQLKIGNATITVGTYRREFSCLSQTISHSKEIFEIAREPGGKSNTIATCTFHLSPFPPQAVSTNDATTVTIPIIYLYPKTRICSIFSIFGCKINQFSTNNQMLFVFSTYLYDKPPPLTQIS